MGGNKPFWSFESTALQNSKRSKHHMLVTPAGKKCVNATKTPAKSCIKTDFKKPIANVLIKYH